MRSDLAANCFRERRAGENAFDLREASAMTAWVMLMSMAVVVMMVGAGRMFVAVVKSVKLVSMRSADGQRFGEGAMFQHIDFGGLNTAPDDFANTQRRAQAKRNYCLLQQTDRRAGIYQGAHQHVAADSGEAF